MSTDHQGINWGSAMTTREAARAARSFYYRAITSFGLFPSTTPHNLFKQEHSPFAVRFFQPLNLESLRPKVLHFQLRNLLAATSAGNVYYAGHHVVHHFNTRTGCFKTMFDTSVEGTGPYQHGIVSLAADHGVLVAGELQGGYTMKSLDAPQSSPPVRGKVATPPAYGSVNHVELSRSRTSGGPVAAFSSNDGLLRLLDCATNTFTATRPYDRPVNCSATSPDGRMRAAVGDFDGIVVTDAAGGAPVAHVPAAHGAACAFACAWSPDGLHLATGGDDRRVVVRDVRRWPHPLAVFPSTMDVPRALRYAPPGGGGPPLLAIAEQDDVVRLADARTYDPAHVHVHDMFGTIAGMGFSEGGERLYVANADRTYGGIFEYERTGCATGCIDGDVPRMARTWEGRQVVDVVRMKEMAELRL